MDKVTSVCKTLSSSQMQIECTNSISSLRSQHVNNVKKFSSISYLVRQEQPRRVKRGFIDAGGSLLKTFFGTLDADDAVKFSDAIDKVQSDEKYLLHLMKDNIHIIKSTISTFNSTIVKVNENQNIINKNLNSIESAFAQLGNANDKLDVRTHLNSLFNSLESIIVTLSFDIDDINNAILFSKLNVLHPSVLSPYQLYNDLKRNMNNLPKHTELPVSLSLQNIHELIDVCNIACYFHDNRVILVLQIPLVLPQTYNLYHVIPLPSPYDISKPDTFVLVAPNKPYVAITADRMFYSLFDNVEKCKVISEKCYVCELNNVFSTIANPICETILLSEVVNSLPKVCETKLLRGSVDVFHKLSRSRWVYVQSEPSKCHITCDNDVNTYDEILFGTGILSLRKDCKAFYKTLQFSAGDILETNVTTIVSSFNIVEDDCCNKTKLNKTLLHLPFVKLIDANNFDSLLHASIHLNDFEQEMEKLDYPSHLHQYSIHYLSLTYVLTVVVFIYLLYRSKKLICPKSPSAYCVQIYNQCNNRKNKHVVKEISNIQKFDIKESSSSEEEYKHKSLPPSLKRNVL